VKALFRAFARWFSMCLDRDCGIAVRNIHLRRTCISRDAEAMVLGRMMAHAQTVVVTYKQRICEMPRWTGILGV